MHSTQNNHTTIIPVQLCSIFWWLWCFNLCFCFRVIRGNGFTSRPSIREISHSDKFQENLDLTPDNSLHNECAPGAHGVLSTPHPSTNCTHFLSFACGEFSHLRYSCPKTSLNKPKYPFVDSGELFCAELSSECSSGKRVWELVLRKIVLCKTP